MKVRPHWPRLSSSISFCMALGILAVTSGCGAAGGARAAPKAPGPMVVGAYAERDADGVRDEADRESAAGSPSEAPAAPPPLPSPSGRDKTRAAEPALLAPSAFGGPATPEAPHEPNRDPSSEAARDPSMIIYTARLTMAVYQVDQGLATVEKVAKDNGGFLSLKRDREITIRVPRARFEPALAAIDKIGDVLHRDIQAQDVTDEFVDLEIRIKNGRAMQARLKQLLERAPVKEALEIEKELHRVTEQLEVLEGRLKLLRDKIAFSTITVAFEPRAASIQATQIRLPFPWLSQVGLPSLLSLSEEKR